MSDVASHGPVVERLATEPPVVILSRRQKFERAVAYLAIMLSVTAFTLSTVAIEKVARQGNCINTILGERQDVSDAPAEIEAVAALATWSQQLLALFALPQNPSPAVKAAEAKDFFDKTTTFANALSDAQSKLVANDAYRKAHPLGRC